MWEVEYTDEFEQWWNTLSEAEQIDISASVGLLEQLGPNLRFPYSSGIEGAQFSHMRELRIQHQGRPYRILYAFDARRIAILLIGGEKTGDHRWYERYVALANSLYEEHLRTLEKESLNNE